MIEGEPQLGCVITYITSSSIGTKKHVLHMLTPTLPERVALPNNANKEKSQ